MEPQIAVQDRGEGVVEVRFATGQENNAMTKVALVGLLRVVEDLASSPPRVLAISGADSFCSGADTDELASLDREAYSSFLRAELALFRGVEALPCATIGVLRGLCLGTGAELALACDLRIATDAMRFAFPEVKLGFAGPAGRLSRYVGVGVARDLLLTGRLVRAHEAERFGLVNEVVAEPELDRAVDTLAQRLAACPPAGITATKAQAAFVYGGGDYTDAALLRDADAAFVAAAGSAGA